MATTLENATLHLEHVTNDTRTVTFANEPTDGPGESIVLDYQTWKELGYPHYIDVSVKTTRANGF